MDEPETPQPPDHRRTAVDALVVGALWLALAGEVTGQEVVAAVLAGVAAALFGARVRRRLGHAGRLPPGSARILGNAAVGAITDTWPLARALAGRLRGRPTRGSVREVPFDVGGDDPADATRRAIATLTCSLQPNSYLVGFDPERNVALVHELVPADEPPIHARLRSRS